MNKTNIEWCDYTYNPVTGCLMRCGYCYAKSRTVRFQGYEQNGEITVHNPHSGLAVLEEPLRTKDRFDNTRIAPFPYGFDPTFYKYRLNYPAKHRTPRTVFVCSMGDLFGPWVLDEVIEAVFESCKTAPWHQYMFLTKNPGRYMELVAAGKLLAGDNIWYGSTVTGLESSFFVTERYNIFLSMEPLLGPLNPIDIAQRGIKLVIMGAETGSAKDKIQPERAWIENVVSSCRADGISVFMKDSLKPFWDGDFMRELPWKEKM